MVRLAAVALLAVAPATGAQDEPDALQDVLREVRDYVRSELDHAWPLRDDLRLDDLLTLTVEDGHVFAEYARTPALAPLFLRDDGNGIDVFAIDAPGDAPLYVGFGPGLVPRALGRLRTLPPFRLATADGGELRLAEQRSPRSGDIAYIDVLRPFGATAEELSDPTARLQGFTALNVGLAPGRVAIMRSVERVDGESIILNLMQSPPGFMGEERWRTTLRVDDTSNPSGESIVLEGATLDDLRQQDSRAYEQYVRPALLELGLTQLVDDSTRRIATALFLADLPTPPEVAARVEELVAALNAPQFARRRQAEQSLRELDRPGASEVARLLADEGVELTPEQRGRMETLVAERQEVIAASDRGDRALLLAIVELDGGPDDAELRALAEAALAE